MKERARAGWAGVLISAALLSACGGGGGDSTPSPVQGAAIPDTLAVVAPVSNELGTGVAFSTNLASATGLTFAWSFGDGTSSSEAAPRHDYAKAGEYAVTLKVTNAAGASKEVKFSAAVNNRTHVQGLSCSGADSSGWCWQAPRPVGTYQYDHAFVDANNGWSVGEQGTIQHTTDGGKSWVNQTSGVKTTLTGVAFVDANNGRAVGEYGAVLRTTDGGKTWALQPTPSQLSSLSIQTDGASTILISSYYGGTKMTVDGGVNWIEGTTLQNEPMLGAEGVLWEASYDGVRRSVDQGRTSSVVMQRPENLIGFNFSGRNAMVLTSTSNFVAGNYVQTYTTRRSLDNGQTWDAVTAMGLPQNGWSYVQSLSVTSGTEASAVISDVLYRTQDAGSNWIAQPNPAGANTVHYSRPSRANGVWMRTYYLSTTSVTEISTDSGTTWRQVPPMYTGNTLKRLGATIWVARGSSGAVGLSTDGAQSWTRIGGPDADGEGKTLTSTWFFDAKRGLAVNALGDLLATADGGLSWSTKAPKLAAPQYYYNLPNRLQFVDDKKGWLQTSDGILLLTDDGGTTWLSAVQPTRRVSAYQFLDATTGFALMTDTTMSQQQLVMTTADGGRTWTTQAAMSSPGSPYYSGLQFGSASKGVLYGPGGRMMSTADGGKTWTGRFFGTGNSARAVTYSDTGILWAVGDSGLLRFSKDDGVTWEAVAGLPALPGLNAVRFVTPQRGWAVGEYGTVLATADAGKTWTPQTSGTQQTLTQVQFTDSRTGWMIGSGGTLLATGTGGQ
ncbi:YCF48-related protein [Mitsuaria sp. 7]|uniref:YCF48-related protein n=1 Tax=Mitsuaria sp. 7 TaxID=1658665 RepID=UPI0007DDB3A2|nr:YCF48-related protein [Mitsuaria sp. 7]ANH69653.1 hypothetical protein ABE85_22465 [Mitsuaria sp. 7]